MTQPPGEWTPDSSLPPPAPPRTLEAPRLIPRPVDRGDADLGDKTQTNSLRGSINASKREAEDKLAQYLAGLQGPYDVKDDQVYVLKPTRTLDHYDEDTGDPVFKTTYESVYDAEGTAIKRDIAFWEREGTRLAEDAKLAGSGGSGGGGLGPAVRTYLDVEGDKTAEDTRQAKDFERRADAVYDLQAAEGDTADAITAYTADREDLRQSGVLGMPKAGYMPYSSSLSNILRPSLPDYVRPDYRLNQAVGLPGPQGFDDPDYGPDGLPMFAFGTPPPPGDDLQAFLKNSYTGRFGLLAKPRPWIWGTGAEAVS